MPLVSMSIKRQVCSGSYGSYGRVFRRSSFIASVIATVSTETRVTRAIRLTALLFVVGKAIGVECLPNGRELFGVFSLCWSRTGIQRGSDRRNGRSRRRQGYRSSCVLLSRTMTPVSGSLFRIGFGFRFVAALSCRAHRRGSVATARRFHIRHAAPSAFRPKRSIPRNQHKTGCVEIRV